MKVKNLENMFRYANWGVIIQSLRYDWNIWKKSSDQENEVYGIFICHCLCVNEKISSSISKKL